MVLSLLRFSKMTSELITFNHLRCRSSSRALGTITGYWKSTRREGQMKPPLRHVLRLDFVDILQLLNHCKNISKTTTFRGISNAHICSVFLERWDYYSKTEPWNCMYFFGWCNMYRANKFEEASFLIIIQTKCNINDS